MADGSVRLADFGLARELDGTHAYAPRVGSSDFLPPEWWSERISERGIPVRPTVDIWALGVTIHQLLTGGLYPFPGAGPRARGAAAQAYADGRVPLRLADELPPEWRAIVADCLAPDHASRLPHTAASILARIPGRARARRPSPAGAGRRRRGRGASVAAAPAATVNGPDEARGAPATVFNAEAACRDSPSDDCRLGLAGDPYAPYAPANVVGRVRHGDRLVADCFVTGARRSPPRTGAAATAGIASARRARAARRGCLRCGLLRPRGRRSPAAAADTSPRPAPRRRRRSARRGA